jgi:hypothetical protein
MAKQRFMDVTGSDPNATMKGDYSQQVRGSTAPGTKPKRPKPVKRGQFRLPREKRK